MDTRSTHNFLDPIMVDKVKLLLNCAKKVKMRVANGELIPSEGKCNEVRVKIQRITFRVDVHILVLVGCDMVLGI